MTTAPSAPAQPPAGALQRAAIFVVAALAVSVAVDYALFTHAPPLDLDHSACSNFSIGNVMAGSTLQEKKATIVAGWQCLRNYAQGHPRWAAVLMAAVYIPLKMICVPGGFGVVLAVLTGALFSLPAAHCIIALSETAGSWLAWHFYNACGAPLAARLAPGLMRRFAGMRQKYHGSLFTFALFMRVTPLVPNWFVNFAAPVVGIPFRDFALATAIAVHPAAFLSVSVGHTLEEMGEAHVDLYAAGVRSVLCLSLLQLTALLPSAFERLCGGGALAAPAEGAAPPEPLPLEPTTVPECAAPVPALVRPASVSRVVLRQAATLQEFS